MVRDMRTTLESSLRAGEKLTLTAERLLDADAPVVELPKYVQELSEAARFRRGPGDQNLYDATVRKFQRQIGRLGQGADLTHGEYTIRSASRQLVRDLQKAKPEQVDKIVNRWVLDRARYQARVIARNESVEAFRESALQSMRKQEWVHGVRWNLSTAHPRPDICDMHAKADLHGLGPGGYPIDAVPDRHVGCLCYLVAISDNDHFDREIAKAQGAEEPPKPWLSGRKETAEEWLRAQSRDDRQAIVGPTRSRMVEQGRKVYQPRASNFKPVYQLQNKSKPHIERGPRIDARAIIAADRASMIEPFPAVGR